jgi:hypothetical protein
MQQFQLNGTYPNDITVYLGGQNGCGAISYASFPGMPLQTSMHICHGLSKIGNFMVQLD